MPRLLVLAVQSSNICEPLYTISTETDLVGYRVPAICGVKQAREHLQEVQFDLPDRFQGVPELKTLNSRTSKPKFLHSPCTLTKPEALGYKELLMKAAAQGPL